MAWERENPDGFSEGERLEAKPKNKSGFQMDSGFHIGPGHLFNCLGCLEDG